MKNRADSLLETQKGLTSSEEEVMQTLSSFSQSVEDLFSRWNVQVNMACMSRHCLFKVAHRIVLLYRTEEDLWVWKVGRKVKKLKRAIVWQRK